jgi:triphosphatase
MRRAHETSCKFDLVPQDRDWLIATLRRLDAKRTGETKSLSLYLDTPDAAVGNLGFGFGLRRSGTATSADIKRAIDKAARGAAARGGWTRFVEPLSAATSAQARRRLGSLLRRRDTQKSLGCIFRTETQESLWSVNSGSGVAEIILNRARVTANGKGVLLAFVTFTCKAGTAADFFRLVAEICAPAKLRITAQDIALRSYRLSGRLRTFHVSAHAPELAASLDSATAFRTIARATFDQFLLNETAVRLARDREAVHQCRVALRRLSASLRLFSPLVSGAGRDDLRPALKQLAAYLKQARDLDVLIANVIEPAVAAKPSAATQDLLRLVEGRRKTAYDALVAAFTAAPTAKLFLRLVAWIETGDWTLHPERESRRHEPIGLFVERKLAKATLKFKERCAELEEANQEKRHHIRIRAKNLRYGTEFFETLVASKTTPSNATHHKTERKRFHAFIGALKELQTILGDANDAAMAHRFLHSLKQNISEDRMAKPSKATIAAIHSIADSVKGLSEPEFLKKAAKARRALAEIKPFWGKLAGDHTLDRTSGKVRESTCNK